jgi:signal transduction histidine kinase
MQREVLEFARGERSMLVRKVYLASFFEDLASQLRRELEAGKVTLVLDLADRSTARFDQGKIIRVIHNLARNAVEAMGNAGGTLSLRVRRSAESDPSPKSALVIDVADTGPGIPKEIEARLFQSFVTAGKKGGTGLGLAIVKKIVEEHEGTISVQSTSNGTTFTIVLPQPAPKS